MKLLSSLSQTGVHETRLRERFGKRVRYEGPPIFDTPLYCIGFFNRSGSNLLADYLRATPYFAGFHEQLNFNTVEKFADENGIKSFPDYIRAVSTKFGTKAPCYGFKASVDQLVMLQRFGIPDMYAGGLRILHIQRRDVIGLAVSYQIAAQTQRWTSQQDGVGDTITVTFDAEQISKLIDAAHSSNNGISLFSEIFDTPRLALSYEDLTADPSAVLAQIAGFAGQDGASWPVREPSIAKQASEINERFRQAYRDYAAGVIL